ncbi:hypothetical protein PHYC_03608 [Phycisphaerales bacterium]|nr:hypothetical protein PHYC_03608 [Phycisphaerales bacterium]
MLRPRPNRRKRPEVRPGDVVRLPRRIIDRVLRAGADDRVLVREIYARRIYVQSLANPAAAFYVRRRVIAASR